MATGKKSWSSQTQVIGTSDGYVNLSTTEVFSSDIDLETNGYEGAHVIVEIDYASSPTDEVTINFYGSLDGVNYDDTPFLSMQGDNGTDPQQLSFIITGYAHIRIGLVQDGSTDTHTARAYYQAWRWDIS